ncbi:MAG: hypothetical protein MJE68_04155 [Proteobacteria bacterium]|nr:hypothetical protein [Pseudomonadota bacterium]
MCLDKIPHKLTHYTTPPEQPKTSTEVEIKAPKKRVYTLELLLNNVMHQLDNPTQARSRPQALKRKPTPPKLRRPKPVVAEPNEKITPEKVKDGW